MVQITEAEKQGIVTQRRKELEKKIEETKSQESEPVQKGGKGKGKGKGKGPPVRGKGKGLPGMKGGKGGLVIPSRWSLPEIADTTHTVWGSAVSTESAVALDDSVSCALFGLFHKSAAPVKKAKSAPKQVAVRSVIDSRRAHQGGILLAQFRGKVPEISVALLAADTSFLTLARIDSLLGIVPTQDELNRCRAVTETGKAGETVSYFKSVADIPNLEQRLLQLRTVQTFAAAADALKKQLAKCTAACEALTSNDELRRVLAVVLQLGNMFNGQQASGTKISALLHFLQMKVRCLLWCIVCEWTALVDWL